MKSIQIKPSLFFKLYDYFIYGDESKRDEIIARLNEKMDRMQRRKLYSDSKTADTEEDREAARNKYLDLAGIPDDYRY